jgi:hypothetical protein
MGVQQSTWHFIRGPAGGRIVKVAVYVAPEDRSPTNQYLVLPVEPEATIPLHLGTGWHFFGTLESRSALFHGVAVELELQLKGYALVSPPATGVWS